MVRAFCFCYGIFYANAIALALLPYPSRSSEWFLMSNSAPDPLSCLPAMLRSLVSKDPLCAAAVDAVCALAMAAANIATVIRCPDADAALGAVRGSTNTDGDDQKALDMLADQMIQNALGNVPAVASYLSEEQDTVIPLHDNGAVIVASDPLDGSSNIDTNVSVGTIFSILPAVGGALQAGRNQVAAGFFVYGPQTTLLVTFGEGVMAFQLGDDGHFHYMSWQVAITADTREFAINASNMRQWHPDVSAYINDCLAGVTGPRAQNFNMRWIGSLVADAWRIFRRGGIFLYPADLRSGYEAGRLRLVYEANPVALLVEAAGGKAVDGNGPILDLLPETLHARVPFIFGSANEVDEFMRYRP
jgi:fructose-1,6-bisphosphatase I